MKRDSGGYETETTIGKTAKNDCSAKPEMDMGEPTTMVGFIANITVMMVCTEKGLYNSCHNDRDPEDVVYLSTISKKNFTEECKVMTPCKIKPNAAGANQDDKRGNLDTSMNSDSSR